MAKEIAALHVDHTDKNEPLDNTDFDAKGVYDVLVGETITIPARIYIDPETRKPEEPVATCKILRVYNKHAGDIEVIFTEGASSFSIKGKRMTRLQPAEAHMIDEISEPAAVVFHIRVRSKPRLAVEV